MTNIENCAVLGYYPASSGNSVPTLRNYLSHLFGFFTLEDGTDKLSRNVDKELPVLAAA